MAISESNLVLLLVLACTPNMPFKVHAQYLANPQGWLKKSAKLNIHTIAPYVSHSKMFQYT